MTIIEDKSYRLTLIEKYLDAETSVLEEKMLYAFYASHNVDEDEAAIAQLILSTQTEEGRYSKSVEAEYDAIVGQSSQTSSRSKIFKYAAVALGYACSVLLLFRICTIPERNQSSEIQMADVVRCLEQMANEEEFVSLDQISLKPKGNGMLLAELKENTYVVKDKVVIVPSGEQSIDANMQYYLNDIQVGADVIGKINLKTVDGIRLLKSGKTDAPIMSVSTMARFN